MPYTQFRHLTASTIAASARAAGTRTAGECWQEPSQEEAGAGYSHRSRFKGSWCARNWGLWAGGAAVQGIRGRSSHGMHPRRVVGSKRPRASVSADDVQIRIKGQHVHMKHAMHDDEKKASRHS